MFIELTLTITLAVSARVRVRVRVRFRFRVGVRIRELGLGLGLRLRSGSIVPGRKRILGGLGHHYHLHYLPACVGRTPDECRLPALRERPERGMIKGKSEKERAQLWVHLGEKERESKRERERERERKRERKPEK
jgi:hypothetical protein